VRRKIIVYIATSADGYIARPDGDVEWLNRRPRTVDYGMRAFYRTIDTILYWRPAIATCPFGCAQSL
jgi:dihydrofolate reductase